MNKYRIRVEALDDGEGKREQLDQEYTDGIECEGFVILADKGEDTYESLHNVSRLDIAEMMAKSSVMMAASVIAKALRESEEITERGKREEAFKGILEALK